MSSPRPPLAADSLAHALRHVARVIAAVIGGRNLDVALAAEKVAPAERPLVMDLAYATLRRYGRGDLFLDSLLARPLADARVRGLLLAALYRVEARPDDVHTTVDQAVAAAAVWGGGRFKGLVNAVLRNFQRRRDALLAAVADHPTALWQHPAWWIDALQRAYPQRWQAILTAGNTHPPMTLRVNARRSDVAAYQDRLRAAGIETRWLGDRALLLERAVAVGRLPGFFDGDCSIQDWGAQHAAPLLDAQSGMRVLDACAAPGGKTAHLLETVPALELLALDAEAARAQRIEDNLGRLHLRAAVKVADCRDVAAWWDGRPFERILADVPCSASGVVRRHPDVKWLRRADDVSRFAATQREILDALWPLLAPGGKMLYCTCSLFPEENAQQVAAFASRHPDVRRLATGGPDNELHLTPCAEHDGFFYALLGKSA
ncbi:MAG: 16S rRNA (cytosine(967)-C(5))-methyltransferase RsmB [Rhodocyclaceae bacterium]|nr:16S rRNA (cytosine(967)-C(5))-methyltransferase RsmB [Rhodocyclaceae bacterium]